MKINATKISHNTCILSSLKYHGSRHKQIRSGSNKEIAEEKKSVAGDSNSFLFLFLLYIYYKDITIYDINKT